MKFDVIIGNPPYQLVTGGAGRQAKPIYNLFVEQAKKLEPRFLLMVIQSRWFGGGMGLGKFRDEMLNDDRIRMLVDYTNSGEVFPGTDFGGGASYFLWENHSSGPCRVVNHLAGKTFESVRNLNEFEHFIRYAPAVPILKKVLCLKEQMVGPLVSSTRPFGIPTTEVPKKVGDYKLISSKGKGYVDAGAVTSGEEFIEKWKVLTSKTSHDHAGLPDKNGQRRVLSRLELASPGTVCTESYILIGPFDSEIEASNCLAYLSSRFARFLISLLSFSQDITRGRFDYLPLQDFTTPWTDEELYKKYGFDQDEIDFIESMIKPMGEEYERDESLESHAYAFIHTDDVNARVNEIFGGEMKFDVIIGNPPYQLNDGGNQASAKPIYQLFIEQAKKLEPRFLTMVVPARWYSGGKGLSDFRNQMLGDDRLRELHDFFDANLVFPGIDISGGVCYFLWNLNERGPCKITTHLSSGTSTLERPLLQDGKDTFIRFNQAVSIVEKVHAKQLNRFSDLISSRKPFGIPTNADVSQKQKESQIRIFAYPNNGFVDEDKITNNFDWVEKYKVMIAYAYGERGSFPYMVTGKPFIGGQGTCCSETYIITAVTDSLSEANNVITYMSTRFFRFLVLLKKNTQHATSKVYELVPVQDFSKPWTDEELYKKYGFDQDEIGFIESMIRPMSPSHHV